ncbi:hypothetical protein BDW59DRAFT_141773 [Aspergillus cavernicola]|uniref:Uncharacterized protein n=1 Tax=Aspergillus cavernicola TaxID=176166 RepID=A0ABR4IPH6_9EURO
MPTPERNSGQTSWARRQQQQQQQQQHNSPFRRARRESLHLDAFEEMSPPREPSARHHRNFSHTGTLRGAFEFASRLPADQNLFLSQPTRRASPRKRRQSSNAMSSHSNPPDELAEAYRRIEDENSLTDLDPSDNENNVYTSNPDKLNRRISASPSRRAQRLSTASDTSFTSESPRRRAGNYSRDEERLKRATTSRSPVLDRAALGVGPSSEHLQRREESHTTSEEEDYGIEPSVNVPSNWGSRARYNQGWMKSLTRSHERGSTTDEPGETSSRLWNEVSSKLSARQAAESAEGAGGRPGSSRPRYEIRSPPLPQTSPKTNDDYLSGGQVIPNTPIVVFPSSTFTKRSPSNRDSQDLLRKLARTGSPSPKQSANAAQTPEATTTARHVYDKTPVVTGAWIDTPMTQRLPSSQPKQAIKPLEPKLDRAWGHGKFVEEVDRNDEKADTEELIPNFEPMREKVKEDSPAAEPLYETLIKETTGDAEDKKEEKKPEHETELPVQDLFSRKPSGAAKDWKPIDLPMPEHPKSALETVLQDHKNNKDFLDVGDDTIESLQALVDQQPTDDTETQEEDAAYEQQVIGQLESEQTVPSSENDFERIEGKLQSLSDTMAHLKTGLNQLGNRVSRDTEAIITSISKSPDEPSKPKPVQPQKVCGTCKTGEISPVQSAIPLPRLWTRGDVWWKSRPTRLGWLAIITLSWYFSESTMCDYYCHPFVSPGCEGNCLVLDAPRFPFVIPTMISRWFHLSDILLPLWTLIVAFFRLFAQLFGFSDGYVDDVPRALNLSGKIWVEGAQVDTLSATSTPTARGFIPSVPQWTWREQPHDPDPVPDTNLPATSSGETIVQWDDISMDEDEFL